MRRGVLLFILLFVTFLGFAIHAVWTLLTLLVIRGTEDAITKSELPAAGSNRDNGLPQLIPKIIHQTYKNKSIPAVWKGAQKSCIDLHPPEDGWEYKLWTDDMMDEFIEQEYVWFLDTFRGYRYPIQRADAVRYFALNHYGGIYIDLDDGCARPLDPLLSYPAWVRKTIPTGVSNDVMGAVPEHPFFRRVIEELKNYDKSWFLGYITVMASTGPLFLSIVWRHYSSEGHNVGDDADGGRVRILFPEEYQRKPWSFFTHHLGNSWHGKDVQLIFWMARNWVLLTVLGFAAGIGVLVFIWWAYHRFCLGRSSSDMPKWKKGAIRSRFPFWRRVSAQKEYELVSRQDDDHEHEV